MREYFCSLDKGKRLGIATAIHYVRAGQEAGW